MSGAPDARPHVSLIVAMDRNGVIGRQGKVPWRLPADLKRFRTLTMGHHILMGRKTWESIGRPLPGRTNIVVTRNRAYSAPGATVAPSLHAALELARDDAETFVIGGGEIYREALPLADRVYMTRVQAEYPGDTFFPHLEPADWQAATREQHAAQDGQPAWEFAVYQRRPHPNTVRR
ncbi:MAG TPA: dihydrofolate reductase [Burkholderiales bacterium]|nr:dihydrofolate reductase [Burkholderiales bacterium]